MVCLNAFWNVPQLLSRVTDLFLFIYFFYITRVLFWILVITCSKLNFFSSSRKGVGHNIGFGTPSPIGVCLERVHSGLRATAS